MINKMKLTVAARSVNEGFSRCAVSAFAAQADPTVGELTDIRTVVSEAVTNAIIHGYREHPEGEVYITVKLFDDRSLVINVRDKGCGIPDIKKAMEPLYSGDPSGERGGMGFTIMQSFSDSLNVRSIPGKGTSVTVRKKLK
ncbi:MAG: anti-sigma F factor [Clostridia bacterium]|nr:anti-sigma F factor [Clostridia bacterium]